MSSPIVAVTGCTGYVATELVKRLLALGYRVHGAADRFTSRLPQWPFRSLPCVFLLTKLIISHLKDTEER